MKNLHIDYINMEVNEEASLHDAIREAIVYALEKDVIVKFNYELEDYTIDPQRFITHTKMNYSESLDDLPF